MLRAPAKQTATDTISTLSGRLNNATLLEDRRAAIQGLRSFAKEYPASVASGALRSLISCLTTDAEDLDTIKVVLETLLMLFSPNENSPEAGEEISLWLADEFTQRQDNITILVDLLATNDFYSRLYSLQLITHASTARPERTQECILAAPLGTSRLVGTLDDPRDAVRNAGLYLLSDITQSSTELQKQVAFQDAFDKIFKLIQMEGGLSQGGIVVQDCLSLLANLIRYNPMNQSYFRETGCVPKIASLLPGKAQSNGTSEDDEWASPQKDKNIWGLLAILRMFLVPGSMGVQLNQDIFQRHGLLQQVLNMAFNKSTAIPIVAEALNTCADMIRGNARLQEGFAQIQVTPVIDAPTNSESLTNGLPKAYVIDALLDLTLSVHSNTMFDARFAACECIKSYFYNHAQIRLHFLRRAIDGHSAGEDETANALTTLVDGPQASQASDPYQLWFAAVLVFHLIFDDPGAKSMLMEVVQGDEDQGEEVLTCIQAISGNLAAALHGGDDDRVTIGYLMLLCGWVFEHPSAVNDFLGDSSVLEVLVQRVTRLTTDQAVVRGLCTMLMGIVYEFSTKDSPIPRRELQPVLVQRLSRERYLDSLSQLRQHPLVRDFEVLPQGAASAETYFDTTFVDFMKDNFSRLARAIDRDPGKEVQISHDGIDRDLVDSLRGELADKAQALQKAEADRLDMERQLSQERADSRQKQDYSAAEIQRIKNVNDALQRNHEKDSEQLEAKHKTALANLEQHYRQEISSQAMKVNQSQREHAAAADQARRTEEQQAAQIGRLDSTIKDLDAKLIHADDLRNAAEINVKRLEQSLAQAREEVASSQRALSGLEQSIQQQYSQVKNLESVRARLEDAAEKDKTQIRWLTSRIADRESALKASEQKVKEKEKEAREREEARKAAQAELDDLLMVFGDLEEKRTRDKKRLKTLGEEISDAEDGDDEEDEEDEKDEKDEESDVD